MNLAEEMKNRAAAARVRALADELGVELVIGAACEYKRETEAANHAAYVKERDAARAEFSKPAPGQGGG